MTENKDSQAHEDVWDYKGLYWDDVNKRYYRWYELKLLMQERKFKAEQNGSKKVF